MLFKASISVSSDNNYTLQIFSEEPHIIIRPLFLGNRLKDKFGNMIQFSKPIDLIVPFDEQIKEASFEVYIKDIIQGMKSGKYKN
jgi:hypothetical protein